MNTRRLFVVVLLVTAVAAPAALAGSTGTTPLTGAVSLVDHSWYCRGPVNLSSVTVVIKTAQIDAVHLASGCNGRIAKLTVVQYHGDGVKIGPGAHDLTVASGSIRCFAHDPGKHQDGVQAMGGQRITFLGLDDQCLSANNSAMFVSEGSNNLQRPTDIVCSGCYFAGGGFPVRIAASLDSGIRYSRICLGKFGSVRISPGIAVSPVDVGTQVLTCGTNATPTTSTTTKTTAAKTSTTEPTHHRKKKRSTN